MTSIRRNGRRAALPTAIAVVFAIAVAAFWGGQFAPPPPPAIAQGAPTNVTARNGANTGEVIVSWTPAFGSQANRVGWASEPEVLAAQAAGNWLEAFNFVDLGASKRTYTVKRLQPGTQHAFLVATSTGSGRYNYSPWVLLTTTAGTPCPTAVPGQHPTQPGFCPITGLPLGDDGYLEIGDTADWYGFQLTVNRATILAPGTHRFVDTGSRAGQTFEVLNRLGRRMLRLEVRIRNYWTGDVQLSGRDYVLDTDAGSSFSWRGTLTTPPRVSWTSELWFDIPDDATVAVLAALPLVSTTSAEFNTPTLFRIPIPSQ